MRLTILAGLLMGLSLAVQATLGAHARTIVGHAAKAVGAREKVVAPWYIASNDRKTVNNQG